MKSASHAIRAAAEPAKGSGGPAKPFFTSVQKKVDEPIQARMHVGAAGDRFEVEADRTADRVVNGNGSSVLVNNVSRIVQRLPAKNDEPEVQAKAHAKEEQVQAKASGEEDVQAKAEEEPQVKGQTDEEKVQAKATEEKVAQSRSEPEELRAQAVEKEQELQKAEAEKQEPEEVQSKALAPEEEVQAKSGDKEEVQARGGVLAPRPVPEVLSRQIQASRGLGNPLPENVRDRMGRAFGADMSGIRIHTDAAAVLLTQSLKAQAFTVGSDIYFGEGKFSPGTRGGEHLLAHELTHTVQQGAVEPDSDNPLVVRLKVEAVDSEESYGVRPEILDAIRNARGEIGKVNAKKAGADGKRVGWERLREYFMTAFGGPTVSETVIDKLVMVEKAAADGSKLRMDALPSWCGIFTWWAMKKSGIPIPDWKLGAPALDAMKLRPAGELPRKGDIALDVVPNNHFAMVTGLESAKDAEGKPAKMVRVATVNGNTAGDDNLGGQVQERWDSISRWDHFLDPVGKLSLPDAPLVTVSREPTEAEAAEEVEASAESAPAGPTPASQAAEATDALGELEQDVAPPAGEMFGEAPPEPDMTLPSPVEQGPAETVAAVEKVELGGSSDAATAAFIDASPSSMAVTQPEFGPAVDSKMKGEQQDIVNNPPELGAKLSGSVDVAPKNPQDIPTDTSLAADATAPGQGDLAPVSLPQPGQFRGNADREKDLDEEKSGSFWDAFMDFIRGFTKGIRIKDDSIDTSAGERPSVDLSKDANPGEMGDDQKDRTGELRSQRDAQVKSFKENPGQANIQPRKVDETFAAPVSEEPAATIEGQEDESVKDFAEAPLPADVRAKADAKVSEKMAPKLTEARTQTTDAATARDTGKKTEIETAETEAAKINAGADADQRKIVIDNRGKVAALQNEGIGDAYKAVNDLSDEATKKQVADRKEIGDHVKTEQGAAKKCIEDGEKEAKAEKDKTEKDAAEKKKKADEEQKKQSWWDRAKNAIKSAVKAITKLIDDAFNALRKFVKETIEMAKNAAIGLINKARNWVVDKINKFRNWAKEQVDKYLKDTFPGLAKRINAGIDAVADTAIDGVNKAADWAIEKVNELANKLAAALDKILSTFQVALKTAVRVVGAVMQGDFAEALRAAIEGACEIAGIDPKPVFDFLDRAGKAIRAILKDPVGFIKKLFGAVGDGISSFFKNIKKHLIEGVIGWLTGALSEVNLTGPFEFTAKGILRIVMEILGLTYANIKARVIKKLPAAEKVFDLVEKGYALIKRLIDEGPGALWEEIKEKISSLKDTVMGAIKNWLITTVIKEGIVWLLSLTNPASAIVKAIKLLYDLVMFLIERYQQIKDFILTVYDAVSAIAAGNFTKVVTSVENALAKLVPVLISLLASLAGLGGIAKQVKKVIETVTKPINKAIDWVVDKIVAFARKIIGKVKTGAKAVKKKAKETAAKLLKWWKAKVGFSDEAGNPHTLSYRGDGAAAALYVASSNPMKIRPFLEDRKKNPPPGASYKPTDVQPAIDYYVTNVDPAEKKLRAADKGGAAAKAAKGYDDNKALADDLQKHLDHMAKKWLRKFFGSSDTDFPPPQLPAMADNVKARSFEADYLVRCAGRYKYQVKKGSESKAHVGNLYGWPDLRGAKLTTGGSKYVRMHLLPHRLGGDAVDSNLTPARGDLYNTPFSHVVEQPAIKASVEDDPKKREPIWYKFEVSYYPASTKPPPSWPKGSPYPADAFPNRIHAAWGFYKKRTATDTTLKRGPPASTPKTETPPLPDLAVNPPAINQDGPTALHGALGAKSVSMYFVTDLLIPNRKYSSKTNMRDTLWLKLGGAREQKRREMVQATYDAVGTAVTMD